MKKIIVLFFVMVCIALSMHAGDKVSVKYTSYGGKGVQLITTTYYNNRSSKVLYGLCKYGVVIIKDSEMVADYDLEVFVFHNDKQVVVYDMNDATKIAEVKVGDDGTYFHRFDDGEVDIVRVTRLGDPYKQIKFRCYRVSGKALTYHERYEVDLGLYYRFGARLVKYSEY